MSNQFLRETLCDGVYFGSVTDPKFKHNRITASLVTALDKAAVTENAIVPFLLRKGCGSCPDFTGLNQRLCELYGASLSCDVSKFGGYQVLDLSIYGVDDRFTLGEDHITEACARLLTDILLDPKLVDGKFDAADVALEKQQIIDTIESQINDKRAYAVRRCKEIMCEGEALAIDKYGSIEDAQKVTPELATEAYRRLVKTAQVEITFVGCGDPASAKKIFADAFKKVERVPESCEIGKTAPKAERVREITDEMDVSQSKLVLGLRTGEIKDRRAFGAMRMMTALFGGTPNSRLFVYVREKLSLCYYCAARYDRLTGLMMVDSGVEKANKAKAYDEILRQLDVMKRGEFTDEEVTATRLLLQTSLNSVGDSLGAIDEWYMAQTLSGMSASPEEESRLMDEVTREDIIKAAQQVTLDTVYFLTGKEAE